MSEVTLVWLDGFKETLSVLSYRNLDTLLVLEVERWNFRYIPLTSLREWSIS